MVVALKLCFGGLAALMAWGRAPRGVRRGETYLGETHLGETYLGETHLGESHLGD